ncbi:MAG: dethiobiotin synthase [Casimicrobiaceae bacterium]
MRTTRSVFVTGTDTAVGKTYVARALLRAHVAAGRRAVGMKPVAAGIADGATVNADVAGLAEAGNVEAPLAERNPYAFAPAVAPHLAAAAAGVAIDLATIEAAFGRLAARADVVVVEGAGGLLVPLGASCDMLDIASRLGLPVLLVVAIRLGCLNHALLSEQAVRARGVELAGWVANVVDPGMPMRDENVAALARRFAAPCVAQVAHGGTVQFPDQWLGVGEPC